MPLSRSHIPHATGVYIMRDSAWAILYIGKALDLSKRVAQYFNPAKNDLKTTLLAPLIRKIDYITCASEREALLLERRLIRRHQPFFNSMWKDDKSYPYLKVTMGEDFPRMFMIRVRRKDKGAYFGPYPKVTPIKGLLRYLWRQKYFPLRPCRWDFSIKKPLEKRKIRACLYYHTKECPAPCAGRITPESYRRIADNACLFFKGDYVRLKSQFQRQMREASRRLDFEAAAQLRDNIQALSQMGERVRIRAVTVSEAEGLAASRSVSDLQEALSLAKPPFHIECFDISHFSGKQTAASMVCFQGGSPHRDHYRKFRIREVPGIDDFKAIREVVRRRYRRLAASGEPLPDLILIDGGKGQLAGAVSVLNELGLKVPLASLAKRLDEVFVPGEKRSVLLGRDRPALRLLQRLRDEAHRFAAGYHRHLRSKSLVAPKRAS